MNISHELGRVGERGNWEPFGDFAIKPYFDFPRPMTGLFVTIEVLYAPGSVDRKWEEYYKVAPNPIDHDPVGRDGLTAWEREVKRRIEKIIGRNR